MMGRRDTSPSKGIRVPDSPRIAFIDLPGEEEIRAQMDPNAPRHPYDFGFLAPMSRLRWAHPRIGRALGAFFNEVMFAPGHLTRAEREMLAAVSAAAQDCYY
jgi:hypothetical protein